MRLQFSPASIDDLIDIGNYIKLDNPTRGDTFVEELRSCCSLFLDQPKMGKDQNELRPNLRSWPYGKYIIFYEPFDERIFVVRVLHSARNIEAIFNPN